MNNAEIIPEARTDQQSRATLEVIQCPDLSGHGLGKLHDQQQETTKDSTSASGFNLGWQEISSQQRRS
jgi:hypothetical protein